MNFAIPKLTRPVDLTGYHPDLVHPETGEPVVVQVWVNPPRDFLRRHDELTARAAQRVKAAAARVKALQAKRKRKPPAPPDLKAQVDADNRAVAAWYAELWSQGDGDPWTIDDVLALAMLETDPALYTWLTRRSWEEITAHRELARKN